MTRSSLCVRRTRVSASTLRVRAVVASLVSGDAVVMEWQPGARGIVIGERYRLAGALRRTGMIDAIDLDADPGDAACRVVSVPGNQAAVDAWEDAWRAAEQAAGLPTLRELVVDEDGAAWAVIAAAPPGASGPLPEDARRQAVVIAAALAEAGLDPNDVTPTMLVAATDGRLRIDGVVWLGSSASARAGTQHLLDLLPPDIAVDPVDFEPEPSATVRPPRRKPARRSRRRLLVPLAIVVMLAGAAAALLLPTGSMGTSVSNPVSIEAPAADVLLGDAAHPLVATDLVTSREREVAQQVAPQPGRDDASAVIETVVVTTIVMDTQPVASAAHDLPLVPAGDGVVVLPASNATSVPVLPVEASSAVPSLGG